MSLNSANAFSYAISGSFSDEGIAQYSNYLENTTALFKNAGGWLGEQAAKTMQGFDHFFSSKAWELGKRLLAKDDGEYVSRFSIGYLGSVVALQGAEGSMRDIIMAHPTLQQLYRDEEISGYAGDFSIWNFGIKEENLFWRKMMNGVLDLEVVDDKATLKHVHFSDTVGGVGLSFREIVDSHKTHAAINHHHAKGMFDITSAEGGYLKSYVPPEEEGATEA